MGTLGQFLRGARETRGIDLREAAQQTRIGVAYLKALEEEDFSRLPGEVFVKGFLKNYGKFLRLNEAEVIKKYEELRLQRSAPGVVAEKEPAAASSEQKPSQRNLIEPLIWGTGIVIALILFLLTAFPDRQAKELHQPATPVTTGQTISVPAPVAQPEKLYLEVVALENTWLLVRTDNSPQKKALLKKGESLIWSADERFLLSYGSAGALKLMLNGRELTVTEPKNTVVRDLVVIASGLETKKVQPEQARPAKPRKKPVAAATQPSLAAPAVPVNEQHRAPEAAHVQEQRPPAPAPQEQKEATAPAQSPAPASLEQPAKPLSQPQ